MGRDLYEAHAAAREVFDRADEVLGRPISRLCFEGPAEELSRTTNAQPAIYTTSLACLAAGQASGAVAANASFVAGHSVGEYSALAAAGALDFDAGLRLVERRGELTQNAASARPGRMAAILGLDVEAVEAICAESGAELSNINAPGQLVVSGSVEAVDAACRLATDRGARRAVPLDVGGAFHSSLMADAAAEFVDAVAAAGIHEPRIPFVSNRTGAVVSAPDGIGDSLVYQLTHPVRWTDCVQFLSAAGVRSASEIGPGRVLAGLVKRISPEIAVRNINGVASLA
jgi:[acyl-carrier-protein] S-malonyltransferase